MRFHRLARVTALSTITLTGMLGCSGHSSASTAVIAPAALSATATAPLRTSSPPTSMTPTASPTASAASSARSRTPGLDVDGDGAADRVTTRFLNRRRAVLEAHLGNGKSLTSKAFPLFAGTHAGIISGYDIDGDHRAEVFVEAPGADGIGYNLFQWVGSTLVAVPAPKGQEAPYLYIGGGRYYESSFSCTGHALVQVKEAPAVADTASLPPDPAYRVTTTTYRLAQGRLTVTSSHTVPAHNHGAAQALIDAMPAGCGTKP